PALPEKADIPTLRERGHFYFALTPTFRDGERLPVKYTGDGANLSPPLEWSGAPEGTKTLALVCDDLDAPRGTWNHWVLWNLPADRRALAEGVPKVGKPPGLGGTRQGNNSWPRLGWGDPTPPPGTGVHRYVFTLYALDAALDLAPGAAKAALLAKMEGHVLARAALTGTYSQLVGDVSWP
ncbi:MAG: YbhB/YbcL family Raf kinase inhibitor-like protein, partial [Phycisphaerae bacterium]